jgi:hypothetical protein
MEQSASPRGWLAVLPRSVAGSTFLGDSPPESELLDDTWLLNDFLWDPVAMARGPPARVLAPSLTLTADSPQLGARRAAMPPEPAHPAALAPALAAPVVALPAAAVKPRRRIGSRVYVKRPAVCHVPGCGAELRDSPDTPRYCFRFRICSMHLRAPEVDLPGGPQRHCQKCCSFQPLSAFEGANRTCARRLAEQAARRRRAAGGTGSSSDRVAVSKGANTSSSGDSQEALTFAFVEAFLSGGAAAEARPEAVATSAAGWQSRGAALPQPREASLKLGGATPGQLPAALAPALASAGCHDMALCLEATPRPGCMLLHLDALVAADAPAAPSAARLRSAVVAGPLRAWLAGRRLGVRCAGGAEAGGAGEEAAAAPAALPRLRPAALLSTAPGELRCAAPTLPLPADVALHCRVHGQCVTAELRCTATAAAGAAAGGLRLTLPPIGADGAARLWLAAEGGAGGASRPVLLTTHADVAAELAPALDGVADEAEREGLTCVLGAALRPGCPARVVAAAAHAALRAGWAATSARLLPVLAAALAAAACDAEARAAATTLLHSAALSCSAHLVRLTLHHGGRGHCFGAPHAADERGVTPMHLAAAAAGGGAAALALAAASPAATVAWFAACDASGATPADVARAAGGTAADTHAVLRRRLHAARDSATLLAAAPDADGCDDAEAELARFMLHRYAPLAGAASGPERALFDAHLMESRRPLALLSPPFAIVIALRVLHLAPPDAAALAAVAAPAQPSFALVWAVYKTMMRPFMPIMLLVNVALLALAGLPAFRGAYRRRGRAALRAYNVFQFFAQRTLAELHFRRMLHGRAVFWPSPAGTALLALTTVHMAAMPLPASDALALLVVQWVLVSVAHATGAPLWPQSSAPGHDALLRTALLAVLAAALKAADARALATWRAARRRRLTKQS